MTDWLVLRDNSDLSMHRSKKLLDTLFILFFISGVILILWKAPFGYGYADECVYISLPYRMMKGDALLSHDWSLYINSILTYPFLLVYQLITPSTDGILLTFRYLYIVVQAMVSLYLYVRLRRLHHLSAVLATLLFLVYTPFNIMALSYNTQGIMLFSIATVTIVTSEKLTAKALVLVGICFAGSVLCCPFLVFAYIAYTIIAFALWLYRKRIPQNSLMPALRLKSWLYGTLGIALLASVFIGQILTQTTLQAVLASLPHVLNNPTHPMLGALGYVKQFIQIMFTVFDWAKEIYLACTVLALAVLLDKHRQKRWGMYFLAASVLTVLYMYPLVTEKPYINYYVFPLNILGLFAYMLTDKQHRAMFYTVWLGGMVYGFCISCASNTGFYNVASATVVSTVASIYFVLSLVQEKSRQACGRFPVAKILSLLATLLIVANLGLVVYARITHIFWEYPINELNTTITMGPEKGLRTVAATADTYQTRYMETQALRDRKTGIVCYVTSDLYLLLADPKPVGSYTSYFEGGIEFITQQLQAYYQIHPEKRADYYYFGSGFDPYTAVKRMCLESDTIVTTLQGDVIVYRNGE